MTSSDSASSLRRKAIERALIDWADDTNIHCLIDIAQTLQMDFEHPAIRANKNIESFLEKFNRSINHLNGHRTNADDFVVLKTIGKGAYGKVQLARHKDTGKMYAMKLLNKYEVVKKSEPTSFWEERFILANANSEWIVKLYYAFQDNKYLYMAMDYMPGGDLGTLLDGYDFSEDWARFFGAEMVLAIDVIHSMGFVHRDLKPDNMLLDCRGHLKLADFGTCIRMSADGLVRCDIPVGTPDYISPEVLRAQEQGKGFGTYGRECDFWSIGICLYEMLCGVTPFYHESLSFTYANIMNHQNTLHFPQDVSLSPEVQHLIRAFLCDRNVRLGQNGIDEIKQHPFFTRAENWTFDTIRDCLAPIVPELKADDDTSYFVLPENDNKHDEGILDSSCFEGNHLPFAGFTFCHDILPFVDNKETKSRSRSRNASTYNGSVSSEDMQQLTQLATENNELHRALSLVRGELVDAGRKLDMELEARKRAEMKLQDLISRIEQEQMQNRQMAVSAEKVALLERQLREYRDKLAQETELVVKLKRKNSELTKNVTIFEQSTRDLNEKLNQMYNKCANQERDIVNLNIQIEQERTNVKHSKERAQDFEARYVQLSEETERLRKGFSDRSQECKALEEKLAEREKQETILELELKNIRTQYNNDIESLKRDVATLSAENKQLLNTSEEATADAVQAIKSKLQDEVDQRQKATSALQDKDKLISVLQLDLKQLQSQWSKLQTDFNIQQQRIEQSAREFEEERHRRCVAQNDLKNLELEVGRLTRLEGQLQADKKELEGAVEHFQQEISSLKQQRDSLQLQIVDLNENLETEQSFCSIYKKECADLQEELDVKTKSSQENEAEKAQEIEKLKKVIEKLEQERDRLQDEHTAQERYKLNKEIEKCKMEAERESLVRQLNDQKQKVESLTAEKKQLSEKITNEQTPNDDSKVQIEILQQKLAKEKVLTQQAVQKLSEVMNRKSPAAPQGRGGKSAEYRKKEKECRQLEQDLLQTKARLSSQMKDNEQLRHELEMVRSLQEQARKQYQLDSEAKQLEIDTLRSQIESRSNLQSLGSINSLNDNDLLNDNIEDIHNYRKEGWLSIPNKQNIKRYGWKRQFVVVNYQKVMFFNSETDSVNASVEPLLIFEISKLFHVRSVTQGDVIRANSDDIPKIFQILYADERETRKEAEVNQLVTEYCGHEMVPITFYMPTSCDVCNKALWSMKKHQYAMECRMCHIKVHKEHVDNPSVDPELTCKVKKIPSKAAAKELLCLAESDKVQSEWVRFLANLIQKGGYAQQERARVRSLGRTNTKPTRP